MYNSLNALLNSPNFHSFRNPNVPMLKLRIGGTEGEVAKRDEARRMVPSPPKVAIRSTLSANAVGVDIGLRELGELVAEVDEGGDGGIAWIGKGREVCISEAEAGEVMKDVDG
jgi:hypothetical protein